MRGLTMTNTTIISHGSPLTFDRFDFSKLRDALGVFFTESREENAAKVQVLPMEEGGG